MIIAGTGHRPDKLGGHCEAAEQLLLTMATDYLRAMRPDSVISGMALGWDTALAMAALACDIPFVAAIPFHGQELQWPEFNRQRYQWLLNRAQNRVIVCPGGFNPTKMQVRNIWMVSRADRMVAIWDGTKGGTKNCIMHANQVHRPVDNLYHDWKLNAMRLSIV